MKPKPPEYQSMLEADGIPLALDGFSCVSLLDRQKWVRGNREFAAIHNGKRYLFTGPAELEKFRLSAKYYSPALNGDCIVAWSDQETPTLGSVQFTSIYQGRIYLLANQQAKTEFLKNPQSYAKAEENSVSK